MLPKSRCGQTGLIGNRTFSSRLDAALRKPVSHLWPRLINHDSSVSVASVTDDGR